MPNRNKLAEKSILVVESQEFMRTIIVDILRTIGFKKIETARNLDDGKLQMKTWLPDVVFCDAEIGAGNGLKFVAWIRTSKDSPNPKIPIIYVTGDRAQEQILAARDTGVNEIIIKPIVPQAVISRLKTVLVNERAFIQSHTFVGPDRRRNRNRTYNGGKRRLQDTSETETASIDESSRETILQGVDAILTDLPHIDVKNRTLVMTLYRKSESLWQLSHATGDDDLDVVSQSLIKYIQAVGISGLLKPELVRLHLEAVR
ncbi:hypothetical protein MNBD_ALPHA06-1141, partial [hydrothermal vent metagenome]